VLASVKSFSALLGGMMKKLLFVLILVALAVAACGGGDKCDPDKYRDKVEPILDEWDDAVDVAQQTARMSLAGQIDRLQEIKREMAGLEVQECVDDAHDELIDYMDSTIDAFLAFLGQEADTTVQNHFEAGQKHLENWADKLSELEE
jgi:hypothetical protein